MKTPPAIDEKVRRALAEHAHLSVDALSVSDDSDLYRAGMTSHATVSVMIALEDELDIEFPQALLKRSTFQSVASIRSAVAEALRSSSQA
ncbi:MAG: acyl carrier protein [Acidimicrobiales bacterium]